MSECITNMADFLKKIDSNGIGPSTNNGNKLLFYRGHSDGKNHKLEPSIFRDKGHTSKEDIMFSEIISSNPNDFLGDNSTFDKLAKMRHYSFPTRLLDVTSNPLVALYFSCNEETEEDGQVIILEIEEDKLKFSDSDTVSCIANLARLPHADKVKLDKYIPKFVRQIEEIESGSLDENEKGLIKKFNKKTVMKKLVHYIKHEKTFFENRVDLRHLGEIIPVKGKMSNERMSSQSGAYLLFGHKAEFSEEGTESISIKDRINICKKVKEKILKELDRVGINQGSLFPHLESSARYISEKYGLETIRRAKP